ncbi:MAG: hypothetical protein ACRDRW_22210 [Pseudonocardiaceae bacterium]
MKRMLWFGLGIAAGVVASRKARGAIHRVTPAGAAENVSDAVRELAAAVGSFGAEVRAGMLQREAELHATVVQRTGMDLAPRQASARARAASARA